MELNSAMTKRAEALLEKAVEGARAPWVDRRVELKRAWNSLDEHDRHLLCLHLDVQDGAQFVLAVAERLGVEDQARRARDFALAGYR